MDLPVRLRQAVEALVHGRKATELGRQASRLSTRYRAETRDGRLHVGSLDAALAYLAVRLPATFAATEAALSATALRLENFNPATQLDIGAGPGTAAWAAAQVWPSLQAATLIEASSHNRQIGQQLAEAAGLTITYAGSDLRKTSEPLPTADLVTLAYVLDEIDPADRRTAIERLWHATAGLLVIVEPGTPGGWSRLMQARDDLLRLGAVMIAPCPHAAPCPLKAPDWCHFVQRVARSRLHRQAKEASVPWEDEKFIYLAVGRETLVQETGARVIARPKREVGHLSLKLCQTDGSAAWQVYGRRSKEAYGIARRADWGDSLPPP